MSEKTQAFLSEFDEATVGEYGLERGLYLLLKAFADDLPEINDNFHKAFRQTDVIDVGDHGAVDMAVWHLLHKSTIFWEVFGKFSGADKEATQ